jgi:hypothetical protein
MAFIVSHELSLNSPRAGFRIAVIVSLGLVLLVWGGVLAKFLLPHVGRLFFGPPVFGSLGGLPRKIFFTAIKCAHEKTFKFRPSDLEIVNSQGKLDRDVTEFTLKSRYHEMLKVRPPEEQASFEESWAEIWKNEILGLRIQTGKNQFITYEEALEGDNLDWRIEPLRLLAVGEVIAPIMKMAQLLLAYLLCIYLDGKINLLTFIQAEFFMGLILCLVLFNYHAHQGTEISFLDAAVVRGLPDDITQRIKGFAGKVLRPIRVTVTKRYLVLIQNYFSTILVTSTFLNAISGLVMVGVVLLFTRIAYLAATDKVFHWYRDFSAGLILIAFGLIASYHLMFLLLRSFKLILAPVIVTLLTAFLPYAFIYLAAGKVDFNEMKNTYLAIGTSVITGLTAAITSRVKKTMEDDDTEKNGKENAEAKEGKNKSAGAVE